MPTQSKHFSNANIITLASANCFDCPRPDSLTIQGAHIQSIGASCPEGAIQTDLHGRTVLPAFTDSHMHLIYHAIRKRHAVDLQGLRSMEELKERVRDFIQQNDIRPGQWVLGIGWLQNTLAPDFRMPTAADLDEISSQHPIALLRGCFHVMSVNSAALKSTGINAATEFTGGGRIELDQATGAPNGILVEHALFLAKKHIPAFSQKDNFEDMILEACHDLARAGITTVHTDDFASVGDKEALFASFCELAEKGVLPINVVLQFRTQTLQDVDLYSRFRAELEERQKGWDPEKSCHLRAGCIKLLGDGSLGGRTAAVTRPYEDKDCMGVLNYTDEQLDEIVSHAFSEGFDVAVHAIGDRAAEQVLNVYERHAPAIIQQGRKAQIIHCQILRDDLIKRMAKLGIIANIQPIFLHSDHPVIERALGIERSRYAYAWRTLMGNGVSCVGSSDAPIEDFNPLFGVYAAVTRQDLYLNPPGGWHPEERLSIPEALELFIQRPTELDDNAELRGILAPGVRADFVVLSEDITEVEPETIKDINVEDTYVSGKRVVRS